MIRVFVATCDRYAWALKGFAHQFNKYWSALQPAVVIGYQLPEMDLPDNFAFVSMGNDPGKDDWSTGIVRFLQSVDDSHFVLLLEDYWLCRGVNHQAVETLHEFCRLHPQVLRMDLTDDRQYSGQMRDFDYTPYYGYNDILWTPPDSPYQMSLQAAIWNRRALLSVLKEGESAWQVETAGTATNVRSRPDLWTLGTRQRPVRYANVFRGGDSSREGLNLTYLTQGDIEDLKGIGAI